MTIHIEWIRRYSDDIAELAVPSNLELDVPSCPKWNMGDLVVHLGFVQAFWARNLLARNADAALRDGRDDVAPGDTELAAWFRSCSAELLRALEEVGEDAACWTWWGEPATSSAVARHQVQEASLHRYDAQLALGAPDPLDTDVAEDGFDEFLTVHGEELHASPGTTVVFRATDVARVWRVGTGPEVAEVTGTVSQLVLALHGRLAPVTLVQGAGERSLRALLNSVDLT